MYSVDVTPQNFLTEMRIAVIQVTRNWAATFIVFLMTGGTEISMNHL